MGSRRGRVAVQRCRLPAQKTKPPAPGQVLRGSWRFKSSTALLSRTLRLVLRLNNSRRDEENQFLVRSAHLRVLEQVAEVRDVAEQRHLVDVDGVLGLDDAADHDRAAIGHEDLRGGLLRD